MLIKGTKNIDKFIYAVKDPAKDNPYDLEVVKADYIKGGDRSAMMLEKKHQESNALRQQTEEKGRREERAQTRGGFRKK